MKKIGIFGGSFSPPHKGHVKSALAFYDALSLDELHVIPAGIPPHKILMGDATPEDRLNMVKLAFSPEKCGGRAVIADDCEIMREGRSYTYETLEHFAGPGRELYMLVGTDMFLSLDDWARPDLIFRNATVVVNRREKDYDESLFEEKKAHYEQAFGARVLIPPYHPLVTSSSEVRALLKSGETGYELRRALDPEVLDYIVEHDLYGCTDAALDRIRARLPEFVSEKRIGHVLSVEKESVSMARLLGLSRKEAFIARKAALLHDITHERSFEEQQELFKKYKLPFTSDEAESPAVLHQFTGAAVARDMFCLEEEGCAAIACHTTGKPRMTTGEMLLCLADYIEKTRPYPFCKDLRRYFYEKAQNGRVGKALLVDCMKKYLTQTVGHLTEQGAHVHSLTLEALDYYNNY